MYSIGNSLPGYYRVYLNTVNDALWLDKQVELQAEDVGIGGLGGGYRLGMCLRPRTGE